MSERVSVIIPTYNYGRFVGQAVQSAVDQTHPDVEIIVVDDGSTDDTSAVLAAFGPRIRVIYQSRAGVATARNRGAAASIGPYLAFLDADDYWHPEKLARQVAACANDPAVGLVHCGIELVDDVGHPLGTRDDGLHGLGAAPLLLMESSVLGGGSGALIPRAVFESSGGFDERMTTSADYDLYVRIASRWAVQLIPDPLVSYRLHGSNMHRNVAAMEHDVMLILEKAFDGEPRGALRRKAYAKMHMVLAGSYFGAGMTVKAITHAGKSFFLDPAQGRYLLGFPRRRLFRARR